MPFQTYQLALELIRKDRVQKTKEINAKLKKLEGTQRIPGIKPDDRRIQSLKRYLEYLKIQLDMNNPRVKYNFDRGIIGLHKPIYRFLLDRKWREYRRPILMQRLTQMHIMPDVLPEIEPVVDVQVRFRGKDVQPGAFVDSLQSEVSPTFKIIPFTEKPMYCTMAVVDPDVPNTEKDGFDYRLHWLVSNIRVSPHNTQAIGVTAHSSDTIVKWLPPHVQKGIPYQRYAMIVFRQQDKMDVSLMKGNTERRGFIMRSFQQKNQLVPIGAFMWRGKWDENTKQVMQRNGLEGWDKMFVRKN